jgi:hypothetical protein
MSPDHNHFPACKGNKSPRESHEHPTNLGSASSFTCASGLHVGSDCNQKTKLMVGPCTRCPCSKKNLLQLFSTIIAILNQTFNVGSTCYNCCNSWTAHIVIDSWNCCNCVEIWNRKSIVLHRSCKFPKFVHMINAA